MSHIVTIQTKLHDPFAIAAACSRLGLAAAVPGTAKLYSGAASGLLVQLARLALASPVSSSMGGEVIRVVRDPSSRLPSPEPVSV